MKKIKYIIALIMVCCLCIGLSACGSSAVQTGTASTEPAQAGTEKTSDSAEDDLVTEENVKQEESASEAEAASSEQENPSSEKEVLVVVFSATGTTKGVAEKIASIEGADLYEVLAAEPYTDDDLNWHDNNSRTTKEQNDSSMRPGIASETIDLSGYSKIYVGYPIWWGEEPRIMDTFVESYDFGNITMIPFCTSSSSGIGRSGKNLAENAGSGNWKAGARFGGGVSEDDLRAWIEGMN